MQVWKMLAAVLYMSNLAFDKVDHEQGEIASISDREVRKFHRLCFFTLEAGYVVWLKECCRLFCVTLPRRSSRFPANDVGMLIGLHLLRSPVVSGDEGLDPSLDRTACCIILLGCRWFRFLIA